MNQHIKKGGSVTDFTGLDSKWYPPSFCDREDRKALFPFYLFIYFKIWSPCICIHFYPFTPLSWKVSEFSEVLADSCAEVSRAQRNSVTATALYAWGWELTEQTKWNSWAQGFSSNIRSFSGVENYWFSCEKPLQTGDMTHLFHLEENCWPGSTTPWEPKAVLHSDSTLVVAQDPLF